MLTLTINLKPAHSRQALRSYLSSLPHLPLSSNIKQHEQILYSNFSCVYNVRDFLSTPNGQIKFTSTWTFLWDADSHHMSTSITTNTQTHQKQTQ
jgi:hypothetical protein